MIKKIKVGDIYLEEWIPTLDDINNYAKLSGDYNPIHINLENVKKLGYSKVIVHGNLTCSVISKVIGMHFPGKGSLILDQTVSFPNPIFPNDVIKFEFLVLSVNYELNILEIKLHAYKSNEEKLNTNQAVLRGKIICQI
mgnify:FL=1